MDKKILAAIIIAVGFMLVGVNAANAAEYSPVGSWTTISDKDGKPRSIVRISNRGGKLYGSIVKVYKRPGDRDTCVNCPGRFKNKRIIGLTILWGLKRTKTNFWSGGQIFDPKVGKIYRCNLTMVSNKKLVLRGYIGFSALGRNQTWVRK